MNQFVLIDGCWINLSLTLMVDFETHRAVFYGVSGKGFWTTEKKEEVRRMLEKQNATEQAGEAKTAGQEEAP